MDGPVFEDSDSQTILNKSTLKEVKEDLEEEYDIPQTFEEIPTEISESASESTNANKPENSEVLNNLIEQRRIKDERDKQKSIENRRARNKRYQEKKKALKEGELRMDSDRDVVLSRLGDGIKERIRQIEKPQVEEDSIEEQEAPKEKKEIETNYKTLLLSIGAGIALAFILKKLFSSTAPVEVPKSVVIPPAPISKEEITQKMMEEYARRSSALLNKKL